MTTRNKRIIAIIITYNPELSLLKENISAYVNTIDEIYLWDNSKAPIADATQAFLQKAFSKITFDGKRQNMGISYGLNQGWQYAKAHGYDIVMTMDQDSKFEDFDTYMNRTLDKWERDGFCLCGPTPNLHTRKDRLSGYTKCIATITSGMLVPIELINIANGYCADFFVDGIDFEFCYHLREKGYDTYIDNESNLIQVFGTPQYKRILGIKVHAYGYSPFRLYGVFKNHIIIWRQYHHPGILMRHIIKHYLLNYVMTGVLLVENNKREKLKAVYKGIVDGFRFNIKKDNL